MSQRFSAFPERFWAALKAIERLQCYDRYLGAFIFGSLARGEATAQSDCDVQVVVNEDNACTNINHPIIAGVKLDLTFLSLAQLKARTQQQMEQHERIPWIAEALIVFDKTGQLSLLQEQARQAKPRGTRPEELQFLQFMFIYRYGPGDAKQQNSSRGPMFIEHKPLKVFVRGNQQCILCICFLQDNAIFH